MYKLLNPHPFITNPLLSDWHTQPEKWQSFKGEGFEKSDSKFVLQLVFTDVGRQQPLSCPPHRRFNDVSS